MKKIILWTAMAAILSVFVLAGLGGPTITAPLSDHGPAASYSGSPPKG